ncbi:MAG TPA: DUF1571 domain-containing protein [Phycisphaerae bacterium]|nr:DUF1571 domain-containing protein [Phycisphaerae bacterium]
MSKRRRVSLASMAWAIAVCGCTAATAPEMMVTSKPTDTGPDDVRFLEQDPVGYLRECLQRSRQLQQYTLLLYRQERLGLIPQLQQPEYIRVMYRVDPLSIKMIWTEPADSEVVESLYVDGKHDNRLLIMPRRGLLPGLPPALGRYRVEDPVVWGKAKRKITEFGLARMVERTLEAVDRAEPQQPVKITYLGLKQLEQLDQAVYHLDIHYPPGSGAKHVRQDLFVGAETRLAAGTLLWLADDVLDAAYLYSQLDLRARLRDEDFVIDDAGDAPAPTDSGASARPEASAPQ